MVKYWLPNYVVMYLNAYRAVLLSDLGSLASVLFQYYSNTGDI